MNFSAWALAAVVRTALCLSAVAAIWLLLLLYRDWRRGELW